MENYSAVQSEKKLNSYIIYGWLLIVVVLLISYGIEIAKGGRSENYMLYFTLASALPMLICFFLNIGLQIGFLYFSLLIFLDGVIIIGNAILYLYLIYKKTTRW